MRIFDKILPSILLLFLFLFFAKHASASDITNAWTPAADLPFPLSSHVAYSTGNILNVLGGSASTGNSRSLILSSTVGQDGNGDNTTWEENSPFPTAPIWHSVATRNEHVYILGGLEENPGSAGGFVSKVFHGISIGGNTVSTWNQEDSLPRSLGLGASTIVGDRIFYSGGFNGNLINEKVYSAVINLDGSLESWEDVSILPSATYGHGMVAYGEYIYIIGGAGSRKVFMGKVAGDGAISMWNQQPSLPFDLYRASVIMLGNYIYVVGGITGAGEVYYTKVSSDGTLGEWETSDNYIPYTIQAASLVMVNDYLYFIGGYFDDYVSTVYKTKLNIAPPEPEETNLNVPLYKQTDVLWKDQVYDSATVWSPNTPGINAWGCAMTSAVMIFRYHGITKLPDGQDLNPGTLNTWLKNQNDGYVNTGWVNWLALTRLSKLAKSQNPAFTFDALEYSRIRGHDPVKLAEDIESNIPGILEVPGHFIVGKGIHGDSFKINDPYYDDRTSLTSYSNTFLSLGRFVPSHTDLSYFMFVVEDGVTVTLKDKNGVIVGDGFTQQPIDEDGGSAKNGSQFYMYYAVKPADGKYTIEVESSSQKPYSLQGFIYDESGNPKKYTQNGIVHPSKKDIYELVYERKNLKKTSIKEKSTFDDLIADIEYFYANKQIKSKTVYLLMKETVFRAKSAKSKAIAKGLLASFIVILETNKKYFITPIAHDILKPQAVFLLSTL